MIRARSAIPALAVAVVLVPAVIEPAIELVAQSLDDAGGSRYQAILTRPAHLQALGNSLLLSVLTVACCALLGTGLALLTHDIGRTGRVLGKIALAPLFLSPVLATISFHFLFARGGIVQHFFPGLDYEFRGLGAALAVHALTMFVYFFLFVSAALARLDWELVAVARTLGGSGARSFFTIVLPLLGPALLAAAALTFMASMASFTAPYVFGGGERYLTTAIFIARKDDLATASALAVLLALASLGCATLFRRPAAPVAGASKGAPPAPLTHRPVVVAAKTAASVVLVIAAILPLLTLLLVSFKPAGRIGVEPLFSDLTTAHYRAVLASILTGERAGPGGELVASIGRSLLYAAAATVANVLFALALVLGVPDRWSRLKRALTAIAMLPFAIPGTVLALALLEAFATSGPFGAGPPLAQTVFILPFAYFVRNVPILVQATSAAAAQMPPALGEASRTLGAGPLRTLAKVTLPLLLAGIGSGAVMAFLIATGEFVASILLYTPRTQPASVAIYAEYSQGEFGTAAAAGVVLMTLVLVLAGTLSALLGLGPRTLSGAARPSPNPVAA